MISVITSSVCSFNVGADLCARVVYPLRPLSPPPADVELVTVMTDVCCSTPTGQQTGLHMKV